MSNYRGLSVAGQSYLENNRNFKIAHLVRIETASSTPANRSYYTVTDSSQAIRFIPQDGVTASEEEVYLPGRLTRLGDITEVMGLGLHKVSLEFNGVMQEEVDKAVIPNKQTGNGLEQSYLNKAVRIYRIYLDPATNQQVDVTGVTPHADNTTITSEPLILFEGVVSGIDIREDISGTPSITWQVSNHFADFNRLNGRITDDATHRALNSEGVSADAVKSPGYATDLGFAHANQSISVLAEYTTIEKAYRLKKKKKWFGLYTSYKMEEYEEEVDKEVDLEFHLSAKALPTVYGTRKIEGIPVFVDTLANDPSIVYVVYAFCEGEIEGFLDFYIDEQPIICTQALDSNERQCLGNAQVGHTVHDQAQLGTLEYPGPPTWPYPTGAPTQHGRQYLYEDAQGKLEFWTYHGTSDQVGAEPLVTIANGPKFFRQPTGANTYWTTDHKLLDTAYIVMKVELQDGDSGRTDIPQLSVVVSGRKTRVWSDAVTSSVDKTTRNPVWQVLDYATSPIFGGGISRDSALGSIDISKFNIDNLLDAAQYYDQTPRDSGNNLTYDPNFCKYWRYLGWEQQAESEMALVEMNSITPNDKSVYDNLTSLSDQCDLSIVMLNGNYYMLPERDTPAITHFDFSELIGAISVKDNTEKTKKNSISASITDPALGWKNNSVTFFNSEYKDADSGIDKKGNLRFNHITNYYCARNLADFELKKSRFSREVNFVVGQKGMLLYPTAIFTLTYSRFNLNNTKFMVQEVRLRSNGTVEVSAKEYDPTIHSLDHGLNSIEIDNVAPVVKSVAPPKNLTIANLADPDHNNTLVPTLTWDASITREVTHYQVWGVGEVTGNTTIFAELTNTSGSYTKRFYNLAPDTYRFYARAVSSQGEFSKVVNTDANPLIITSTPLPNVANLRIENISPIDPTVWYGPDLQVAWDGVEDTVANADLVENYIIQIRTGGDVDIGPEIILPNTAESYSFTLANNVALYAAENAGAVGVYRDLKVAVRSAGTDSANVTSPWTVVG